MSQLYRYVNKMPLAWVVLGIIFILALFLRLWGIDFGLPYLYHFDERFYVSTALRLGAGELHNHPYAPTGFANILFVEYAFYFLVGRLLGWFASVSEFEMLYRADPSAVYLLARATSATFGALTVVILYKISLLVDPKNGRLAGLLAAFFLAFSFLHVRDSHYAVPDVAMAFFVTLAVFLVLDAIRKNSNRSLLLASLTAGLAVAMKWTALPVVLLVWWASVLLVKGSASLSLGMLVSGLAIKAGMVSFLGFAIGSPQILINPMLYINEALGQFGAGGSGGFEIWQVDTLPGWLFYGKTLTYGLGVGLLLLGVVGAVRRLFLALGQREQISLLLLLFPLVYYLLMGSTRHYFARYSVPLIPFLSLFAAEVLVVGLVWLAQQMKWEQWLRPLLAAVSLVVIFPSAVSIVQHNTLLTREDTRTEALVWIKTNLPEGTRIAADWETHTPPVTDCNAENSRISCDEAVFDVLYVGKSGLSNFPLTWYEWHGFNYLITSSFISEIPLVDPRQHAERQAFYDALDELELIQYFTPWQNEAEDNLFVFDEIYGPIVNLEQRNQPGPIIRIYRLPVN
jgi:hypothetical protein